MRLMTFIGAGALLLLASVQWPRTASAFDGYQISDATHFENLDVRFIRGAGSGGPSPIALQEAVATGGATVYATDDGLVYARNVSAAPVFVGLGTLLKGGWQDQVVARNLILPPRSGRVRLDTFCVDPFRSTERRGESDETFSVSGALFPWHIARMGMLTGTSETEAAKDLRGLQVWWSIDTLRDRLSRRLGAPLEPPTPAYWKSSDDERTHKLLAERRSGWTTSLPLALESRPLTAAVRKYERALLPAAATRGSISGAIFAINGKIVGAEIYRSPRLFQQMWPHLLRAFAIEALASGQAGKFDPPPADTVAEFLRSSEAGPARAAAKNPVRVLQGDSAINSLVNELGLTSNYAAELVYRLDATPTSSIKSLVRDSEAAIFAETSDADGQWVNRSFLPKLDRAAKAGAPEELIISAIVAGQVEGHAFDSFGADTQVIARPAQDGWSLTVEGVRPAVALPAPASLPRQSSRRSQLADFALPAIAVATLLGLALVGRRRSGRVSIAVLPKEFPVASPALEAMRDAVQSPATVLPPALPAVRLAHVPAKWNPVRRQGHAPTQESTALPGDIGSPSDPILPGSAVERPMPYLVAVAGVEEFEQAPPLRPSLEVERLAA
jgi:hypothetical protein